jgi:hypothetical protein
MLHNSPGSIQQRHGQIAFLVMASMTAAVMNLPSLLEEKGGEENGEKTSPFSYQLDVDFMDRLARKPYLNFRSPATFGSSNQEHSRPAGVPTSLRILTVDLPEVSQHGVRGGGGCRLAVDRVYPDGVAPPKRVLAESSSTPDKSNHPDALLVEQKAWVTSLYECCASSSSSSAPGVQILQASTAAMNPYGMRQNVQVGKYRYDPSKFYVTNSTNEPSAGAGTGTEQKPTHHTARDDPGAGTAFDAPWHQYAWLEELDLRLSGQVRFGESLEPASFLSRNVWGYVYKRTVHSGSRGVLESLGLFGHSDRGDRFELETNGNAASHKPHVVIANGEALQKVPHALRWLQKACRDQGIPLFVVKDPRRWGSARLTLVESLDENDLGPVLRQARRTVKDRIVQACLRAGTGFDRGLRIGRMEANARWEAKELVRKSKEVFQGSPDWRSLDERQLEMKLRERGIIEDDSTDPAKKRFAKSLISLASKCIENEKATTSGRDTSNGSSLAVRTD